MENLYSEKVRRAIAQFQRHGIRYELMDATTGHFYCWRKVDGKLFQFYAETGAIRGFRFRGLSNLIKYLTAD